MSLGYSLSHLLVVRAVEWRRFSAPRASQKRRSVEWPATNRCKPRGLRPGTQGQLDIPLEYSVRISYRRQPIKGSSVFEAGLGKQPAQWRGGIVGLGSLDRPCDAAISPPLSRTSIAHASSSASQAERPRGRRPRNVKEGRWGDGSLPNDGCMGVARLRGTPRLLRPQVRVSQ